MGNLICYALYLKTTSSKVEHIIEMAFVLYDNIEYKAPNQLGTEEKLAQEIRPLLKINDCFKKIDITSDTLKSCYTEEGILMMNVYNFLLTPELIDL